MTLFALSARNRILVWGGLLVLFLIAVFVTIVSYAFPSQYGLVGFFTRYHFEAMLGIALGGVLIGALSFRLLSEQVQTTTHTLQHNTQLVLGLLNADEQACVEFMLQHNGKAFQHELARLPNMNRLKAHRIVTRLSERNVVEVESNGKARHVKLLAGLYKPSNEK